MILGAVAVFCGGCGGSGSSNTTTTTTTTTQPTSDATVVTNNLTKTYAWNSLVGKTNLSAFIRGAESGTTVMQRPITIVSAYVSSGEDVFTMLANGTDVYGPGDSGSPIVLADGFVVGALFAGDDPQHLYGVSITQEMTSGQTVATRLTTKFHKPTTAALGISGKWAPRQWFFSGSSALMPLVTKQASFAQTRYVGGAGAHSAPSSVSNGSNIIPGVRYASAILNGPQAQLYVAGTYTYEISNGKWVATGHPIEGAGQGPTQWPVLPAYVDFIENDGTVESHINGNPFATLAFDGPYGSLIDTTKAPTLLPVAVSIKLNGSTSPTVVHSTVLDEGSSYEEEGVDLGGVTPVVNAIGTLGQAITGYAEIEVTQGGVTTQSLFPDNGLGTISTEGPETALVFYSDLETAIDTAWTNAYLNNPTTQVEKVSVSVVMTTSAFSPKAR
jgi:hypothetical protein